MYTTKKRFFLDQDRWGKWWLVRADHRDDWLAIQAQAPQKGQCGVPRWAIPITVDPDRVTFENPAY